MAKCNCELQDCVHNTDMVCQAPEIQIIASNGMAECSSYESSEGMGEGLMGGPGGQMDKALY
jgi:hypothetical protein